MDADYRKRLRAAETGGDALRMLLELERANGERSPLPPSLANRKGPEARWRDDHLRLFVSTFDVDRLIRRGERCVGYLWPRRGGRACRTNIERPLPWCTCTVNVPALDHPALFARADGSRLLVGQPYWPARTGIPEGLEAIAPWVKVTWLDESWSFYNPGETSLLVVEAAGELPTAKDWRAQEFQKLLDSIEAKPPHYR